MVMLPTQLGNERAIGMYYRRGWQLSITDPAGGVWMVREPQGFYEEYLTPDPGRPIHAAPAAPGDYVGLDYLLSRPAAPIRLLPLGLVGNRRFVSFTHDWSAGRHVVAHQQGRPVGIAVGMPGDDGTQVDTFALHESAMAAALEPLLGAAPRPWALVSATDVRRREVLKSLRMRLERTVTQPVGGEPLDLCRYVL